MRESILIQRKRSIRADTALLNAVCLRSVGSVLRVGALLPTGRMPCPGILKKRAQKGGEILLKHASGVQQNAMRLKKSRLPYAGRCKILSGGLFHLLSDQMGLHSQSAFSVETAQAVQQLRSCRIFSEYWMTSVIYGYGGRKRPGSQLPPISLSSLSIHPGSCFGRRIRTKKADLRSVHRVSFS